MPTPLESPAQLGPPASSPAPASPGSPAEQARWRAQQRLEPLAKDRFGVRFTADTEFRDLLEKVRALASHRLPSGDLKTLLHHSLQAYQRELEKDRFALGKKPRVKPQTPSSRSASQPEPQPEPTPDPQPTPEPEPEPEPQPAPQPTPDPQPQPTPALALSSSQRAHRQSPSRYIPASVAREVYVRDHGQCSFVSDDGLRCASRRFLELDHIHPHASGGAPTAENLRLRCGAHNRMHARVCFGARFVEEAIERGKARGIGARET